MKKLLMIVCCSLPWIAIAEDVYTPPTVLTDAEVKAAEMALEANSKAIQKSWQARLKRAKQNDKKISQSGMPLKRPYYGDFKHTH